ncbi:hypothetical protein AKJ09_03199 [Labilithrix luteola]|uniref:PilZ domain-containing protein n=1 Tax=Labilithrix luteola TaxID=1391654 RepID=A0A0K1PSL9_9BACT|nr:PilZ domain-containing protein [Labilithrix luteola]AKU96535.1 hypothetical protein AKJ09_03199 [Labilithrix luteola]
MSHFRAHERRSVRLPVDLVGQRSGASSRGLVIDVSLAGAGLETEEALLAGEHLTISFATPTLWDPLVVMAVVAWAQPPQWIDAPEAGGRGRLVARAGVQFEFAAPADVLAMFDMLSAL